MGLRSLNSSMRGAGDAILVSVCTSVPLHQTLKARVSSSLGTVTTQVPSLATVACAVSVEFPDCQIYHFVNTFPGHCTVCFLHHYMKYKALFTLRFLRV